ncbi:MAG TPA: serine hydrolase domain-containing protein, partial [Opitutaceae bacterium]|nr:serine hydrolase domain-containing protein [Opitutaceae bacterium]
MKPGPALLLAAASLGWLAAPAMTAEPAPRTLAEVVADAAAKLPAGGIVAAEIDHGAVHYTSAGDFAPRPGIPPEKVIFEIGSMTKVFTGLLLADTVNEGKARLDDPIGKFLPASLKLAPEVAAITLEQLATHTSGLP